MKTLTVILATIAFMFSSIIPSSATPELEPCVHEDSVSCYWDAQTRGNGLGQSFISDEQGNPTYTDVPVVQPVVQPVVHDATPTDLTDGTPEDVAWMLFDATHAIDLVDTSTPVTIIYVSHSYNPYALTSSHVTVWDNHGNHYLFHVSR